MGQYEPNDSRKVTLSNDTAPGEPDRTGPREGETRQQQGQQRQGEAPGKAQAGYGNSRDADGKMEQDAAPGAKPDKRSEERPNERKNGDAVVGETSTDPARQAQADAKRPLGSD
ncbi:hypothetical protein A9995_06145 [Erythrobacter sp. QSSC1-22B]|uniref:hypothetical protein n=1 Tax=Erythrobacter sp. QSSC1-22B TaxID=1860125 RepID=UPI000804910F|nr:hypothetical protein [Erythrobacter sp. QSSC1-22B]OBX19352.1 hypothetical protein A9995_06145 [Erythrobacter sp. QSSC1-22B]